MYNIVIIILNIFDDIDSTKQRIYDACVIVLKLPYFFNIDVIDYLLIL